MWDHRKAVDGHDTSCSELVHLLLGNSLARHWHVENVRIRDTEDGVVKLDKFRVGDVETVGADQRLGDRDALLGGERTTVVV